MRFLIEKKVFSLIAIILSGNIIYAQNSSLFGVLPKIVVSAKLPKNFKLTGRIESRQVFYEKTGSENIQYRYDYKLTDISSFISLKIAANQSVAFGYRIGVSDNEVAHQLIQQFSIVQNLNASRIGHRFSTDQTFLPDNIITYRVRYRIVFEKPLVGDKIDPKEFYLKISNEFLAKLAGDITDLELRLVPLAGYEINNNSKVEFGVDYRLSNFIESDLKNRLWLSLGWYFSVN